MESKESSGGDSVMAHASLRPDSGMRRNSRYLLRDLARAMRREPTLGERRVWEALRQRRCLGLKFRRQAIIGGFIVDFYCPELRLIIEVDGAVHNAAEAQARDRTRDQLLAAKGLRVVRIRDEEANRTTIQRVLTELTRRPPSPYHGEGDRG